MFESSNNVDPYFSKFPKDYRAWPEKRKDNRGLPPWGIDSRFSSANIKSRVDAGPSNLRRLTPPVSRDAKILKKKKKNPKETFETVKKKNPSISKRNRKYWKEATILSARGAWGARSHEAKTKTNETSTTLAKRTPLQTNGEIREAYSYWIERWKVSGRKR